MKDILWTEEDVIWSDNPYYWNHVVEITAVAENRTVFVDVRRKQDRYKDKKQPQKKEEEQLQYIKLVCIVEDERFEQVNYINNKLRVDMLEGDFIVTEVKHLPNVTTEEVKWRLNKVSNNEIKVSVNNIKVI